MYNNTAMPYSIAMTPISDNNGFGGDGSWWVIILVLIVLFGGWGNGGFGAGGGGAANNYVLASDFATLQRMIQDGNSRTESKLDGVNNGICSLGYDQLGQMNGINQNIFTTGNALQTQIADCCCTTKQLIADVNYNMATQANGIQAAIANGFCQTNFNEANNTRDLIDNQNANTRAILEKLNQQEVAAKDAQIANLQQKVAALDLAASQAAQNQYIIGQLAPKLPIPAYPVPNPFCNCNNGYNGFGYYNGTTIA